MYEGPDFSTSLSVFAMICLFFFFPFIFISWRLITLQYCNGFCHTLTCISHGFTCVPHPDPPSLWSVFSSHPVWYEVAYYLVLIYIYVMVNAGWVFFPVFIGHLFVFFGEISIQIHCSFKIGLFVLYYGGFLIYLYSGYRSPSLDVWYADIFFHSMGSFYFHFPYSVLKKLFFVVGI